MPKSGKKAGKEGVFFDSEDIEEDSSHKKTIPADLFVPNSLRW